MGLFWTKTAERGSFVGSGGSDQNPGLVIARVFSDRPILIGPENMYKFAYVCTSFFVRFLCRVIRLSTGSEPCPKTTPEMMTRYRSYPRHGDRLNLFLRFQR